MIDYGRNLVGNIKVKTRSSGGDFVDMGKTKSDIDKNIHEMEKLVSEIKADPKYSSDSGKMINDLKEDIRKLKLIKYDSQGKPTEESLMGIYGKDVKNAKFKDKDGTLFEVSQFFNGSWYYEIFDSNGHRTGYVGPFRYEDDAIVALKRHNSTVRKISNVGIPPINKTSKSGTSTSGKPNGGVKKPDDKDKSGRIFGDYLMDKKTGNKNVVTLKSIPKRIDLDKKSDLEKAIKDITDLSKDYEHGIKVNDDDKYMHDKFVGLLKEANDEVKELKKVLSKLV